MIRRPFQLRFVDSILNGTKRHTIRPTPARRPVVGEDFVGYYWTGKPYLSPQQTFFKSTVAHVATIRISASYWITVDGELYDVSRMRRLGIEDGFESIKELLAWFVQNHGLPFQGILIEWKQPVTDLRGESAAGSAPAYRGGRCEQLADESSPITFAVHARRCPLRKNQKDEL